MSKRALQEYQQVSHQGTIPEANPYKLIQMLMQGALDKLYSVKAPMLNKEIAKKGNQISTVISILDCLQNSLDFDQGGEVAYNLNDLYEYMMQCLTEANLHNDINKIDEVIQLLINIKAGWDGIEPSAKAGK